MHRILLATSPMKKQFTTTLPITLITELDAASRETGRSRNDILHQAITEWLFRDHDAKVADLDKMIISKRNDTLWPVGARPSGW